MHMYTGCPVLPAQALQSSSCSLWVPLGTLEPHQSLDSLLFDTDFPLAESLCTIHLHTLTHPVTHWASSSTSSPTVTQSVSLI